METSHLIGLALMLTALPMSIAVSCISQRARDAAFFLMVVGTVLTEKLQINFFSHYWYRGTTRGFEFTFVDILAIGVLAGTLLRPPSPSPLSRHGGRRGLGRGVRSEFWRQYQAAPRWFWPASLGLTVLYFFYGCFSVAISEPKIFGLFELSRVLRTIVIFLAAAWFVRSERELGLLALALSCAVCFEGALAIKQRILGGVYRVPGTLDDANSLSMYLCLAAPVLVAAAASDLPRSARYLSAVAIGFAAVGVLFTISRAGIPIFALVTLGATAFCVSWRVTPKKLAVTALICLGVAGLVFKSWNLLKYRYSQATLQQEFLEEDTKGRGLYLRQAKAILEDRFFGVGLNNWSYWVSKDYGGRLGEHYENYDDLDYQPTKDILPSFYYAAPAHNLVALTVGELGWPGLIIFALLWWRWFQMGARFLGRRSAAPLYRLGIGFFFGLCGVFLQSQTEWVFRQTQILFAFHIVAGALASLYYLRRKSKFKTPNSIPLRAEPNLNAQTPARIPEPVVWSFALGASLKFGGWSLELSS